MVSVSTVTIENWEHGRCQPRARQLQQWLDVKGIGKREAWRRLGYA
jgi:DNA-binding transcriptional regulator YiaG